MPQGPVDITIVGANQLDALSRRLRAAGERGKGLRKEMLRAIRNEVKPLVQDVKRSAGDLPQRGGLSAQIAKGVASRTRATGPNAGVRIIAKNTGRRLDRGDLRHPLFGDRGHWYSQRVKPRWFTGPLEEAAPKVRAALIDAMDDVRRQVEGH